MTSSYRGLTAVELLVVVAIVALLATVVIIPFRRFYEEQSLRAAAETALAFLAEARAATLSSAGTVGEQYGVQFESDRLIKFAGTTYGGLGANDVEYLLPDGIELTGPSLSSGGREIVFARLTGAASAIGTITFRLVSNHGRFITIRVEQWGVAYLE